MTGAIRYDAEGLRAFAATCEAHADHVCVQPHPAVAAASHQATVAAVSALHAAASGTGDVLGTRIRSTAAALAAGADRYSQTESGSADALDASLDAHRG